MKIAEIIDKNNMPFQAIFKNCKINGISFNMIGTGKVAPVGTYNLDLNFSKMPPRFHPIAMTSWTHSISCNTGAVAAYGALSFFDMGIKKYKAERTISFDNGGELKISAESEVTDSGILLEGTVSGNVEITEQPSGLVFYKEKVVPRGPGKIEAKAKGSIFIKNKANLNVTIHSVYYFDKSITMEREHTRHVTEFGGLEEMNYKSRLTSIVFNEDPSFEESLKIDLA